MIVRKSAAAHFVVELQLGALIWKAEKALILGEFINIRTDFFRNRMTADYKFFGLSGEITITFKEQDSKVLVDVNSHADPSRFIDVNERMQKRFRKNLRLEGDN